jgi:hypothetical protein
VTLALSLFCRPRSRFRPEICIKAGSDIALHLNPRFDQGKIALNSLQGGAWGKEELLEIGPLGIGAECEMLIVVEDDKFVISLNGQHHGEFRHRVGKHLIGDYELKGFDVKWVKLPKVPELKAKAEVGMPKVDIEKPKVDINLPKVDISKRESHVSKVWTVVLARYS